jgi:phospholipid/cholesterol/gamma-HCH transport system ATP-binding protein
MIEIENIKKSFNGKSVLKDISLTIPDGETMVIIGCSGCGKTVLLRSIIGLIRPDSGKIWVDGEEITKMNRKGLYRLRKKFGMLFQGAALFDSMTVEENVGLALKEHTQLSDSEIKKRVIEELEQVGLPKVLEKRPAELSGGMKKRVGLARALIMNPRFVLFDEPTTGLDPIMADNINKLIIETHQRLNITSIAVTHDMHSVFKIASRIAMICGGHIVICGTPSEIQQSDDPVVQQFIRGGESFLETESSHNLK